MKTLGKIAAPLAICALISACTSHGGVNSYAEEDLLARSPDKVETAPIVDQPKALEGEQSWRDLDLSFPSQESRSVATISQRIRGFDGEIPFGEYSKGYLANLSPFANEDNAGTTIKFSELGEQSNKTYQGEFKEEDLNGKFIEYAPDSQTWTKKSVEKINYIFRNTPYASYGALFTNENDIVFFNTSVNNQYQLDGEENSNARSETLPYTSSDGGLRYSKTVVDSLKGSAKYQGKIFASAGYYVGSQTSGFETKNILRHSQPQEDGDITLTADWDNKKLSGEFNSKLLNKTVKLSPSESVNLASDTKTQGEITINDKTLSETHYNAKFVGENAKGLVGDVEVKFEQNPEKDALMEYHAVFGAEQTP